MESLFKSVAIIGKYASGSESSDIESQLLELAQYLTRKHINIFIEAKTHQSGKFQAFNSISLEEQVKKLSDNSVEIQKLEEIDSDQKLSSIFGKRKTRFGTIYKVVFNFGSDRSFKDLIFSSSTKIFCDSVSINKLVSSISF